MKKLNLPSSYEYIGVFLTFQCVYKCRYCVNRFESDSCLERLERRLSGGRWVECLSRLHDLERPGKTEVPITLQGGEPTQHEDFFDIVVGLPDRLRLDVLTNLSGGADEWIEKLDPARFRRNAPYAPIRVSYHPLKQRLDELAAEVEKLVHFGFPVGVYGIEREDFSQANRTARDYFQGLGVDFRIKEFLGFHRGELRGTYSYPDACDLAHREKVSCKTSELLVAPDGKVYRCHHDIYEGGEPIGDLTDNRYQIQDELRPCPNYGHCNPCDVKLKTNREQKFGYTAAEIRFSGN